MAKVLTVAEAIESIKSTDGSVKRFNKKNFNVLLKALANDCEFTTKVAKKTGDNECTIEEILVTKEFRKWIKKVVEKAGVDSTESEKILSADFTIDNVDGLYEFFTTALYEYMSCGNKFDLPSREDFTASLFIKDIDEKISIKDAKNPKDGTYLGTYETTKKKHRELSVKSSCPKWLSSKREVEKK